MASTMGFFGLTLVAVFFSVQMTEAMNLPIAGLLNEMPKNCSGASFCLEKHEDYPQDKIDALLSQKYNLVVVDGHESPIIRDGTAEDDSDCEKNITYGEIYEIIDEQDNIRIVVQSPKLFRQHIRIEQCVTPGRLQNLDGSLHFSPTVLDIYNISCVEKTMDYSFLVLTKDGQEFESVKSKKGIPICCTCRLIETDETS